MARWKRRLRRAQSFSYVAFLCLAATSSSAAESAGDLRVTGDEFEILSDERTIFSGNVRLTKDALRIEADKLELTWTDGDLQTVVATGQRALFHRQLEGEDTPVEARATQIVYRPNLDRIELTGNAELRQQQNTVRGESITFDIERGELSATSDPDEASQAEIVWRNEE